MNDGEGAAAGDVHRALAAALAAERMRIVASLIRMTGDWDLAEDAVADAAERALTRWPRDGIPAVPAAWLTTAARRRALDVLRRAGTERAALAAAAGSSGPADDGTAISEDGGGTVTDDRLRLIFTCCHPALSPPARVALTLRVVCGLPTAAVARVFLTSESTMGARLLRAKRRIRHSGIPYRVPTGPMLWERADAVLGVVYLIFTSGYAAAADDALADEAIRLARLLVELLPQHDEARALLALLLLQHSRRHARRVPGGELVTLENQDRTLWNRTLVGEARDLLARRPRVRGCYRVQAEIAAVHAAAPRAEDTDWTTIRSRYDELVRMLPTPVVALNRAIAVGMASGPDAGLAELAELATEPRLARHHLLPAATGDLLARSGRAGDAVAQLDRAIALAATPQERGQLWRRRAEVAQAAADPSGGHPHG
ncbi:MAG: RNA polymerase sigma factor [Kineosporiaceae bacterium]